MNIFNWMGVFLCGPCDAILCLVLFHVIFSASCRDLDDGGPVGGRGVYWMAVKIQRTGMLLRSTKTFQLGMVWVGEGRIEGIVESGEWGRFWTTHPHQWEPERLFLNLSAFTYWASKLDYIDVCGKPPTTF